MCNSLLPEPYLDLGEQPLANALVSSQVQHPKYPEQETKFPLAVSRCGRCGLSQLTVVVDPEVLYSGYRFRSGASPVWRQHCDELAKRCTKEFGDFPPRFVLDIAANDGVQGEAFHRRGWKVIGVDPADCGAARANIMKAYWAEDVAQAVREHHGLADLIIAQNVLGHVDDPIGFLKATKTVLAEQGRVLIEVPHVGDLLKAVAFDTVYHEHLSYWSLGPLNRCAYSAGLKVVRVEKLETHGGSRRYWLTHAENAQVEQSVWEERFDEYANWINIRTPYGEFATAVENRLSWLAGHLVRAKLPVMLWGASAKATVILNALRDRREFDYGDTAVIDETPEKQGLLMPGVHIPVIAPPDSLEDVSLLWITSWNNWQAIAEKARSRGFKGRFLITSPIPKVIDA